MKEKSEGRLQQECIVWFRNNYCLKFHEPRFCIFSVPNERKDKKELSRMIATGLLGGVSDLIVLIPNKVLFVEMKDAKGTQQPNQKDFEVTITNLGFEYHLIRSLEEFQELIRSQLKAMNL